MTVLRYRRFECGSMEGGCGWAMEGVWMLEAVWIEDIDGVGAVEQTARELLLLDCAC